MVRYMIGPQLEIVYTVMHCDCFCIEIQWLSPSWWWISPWWILHWYSNEGDVPAKTLQR